MVSTSMLVFMNFVLFHVFSRKPSISLYITMIEITTIFCQAIKDPLQSIPINEEDSCSENEAVDTKILGHESSESEDDEDSDDDADQDPDWSQLEEAVSDTDGDADDDISHSRNSFQ